MVLFFEFPANRTCTPYRLGREFVRDFQRFDLLVTEIDVDQSQIFPGQEIGM